MSKKKKNKNWAQGSQGDNTPRDRIELDGVVDEAMPGTLFRVLIPSGVIVLATLAGKLHLNKIRILPGDNVRVEVSPYDMTRGRITRRL